MSDLRWVLKLVKLCSLGQISQLAYLGACDDSNSSPCKENEGLSRKVF